MLSDCADLPIQHRDIDRTVERDSLLMKCRDSFPDCAVLRCKEVSAAESFTRWELGGKVEHTAKQSSLRLHIHLALAGLAL
jgi:hypothetical protein